MSNNTVPIRGTDSIVLTHMVRKPSRTHISKHQTKDENNTNNVKHSTKNQQHQHVEIVLQSRNQRDHNSFDKDDINNNTRDSNAGAEREEQARKDRQFLQRIGANPTFPVHLDYSFRDLKRIEDVAAEQPRQPPVQATKDMNNFYENVTGIRLNNNQLESLGNNIMFRALGRVLARPIELTYIDLSFNRIYALDKAILEFRNLAHLNLHGNKIESWDSLEQLGKLQQLKHLTLHGNLLDHSAQARYLDTAVGLFPTIEKIDFTLVTREDRERSAQWIAAWKKARKRHTKMLAKQAAGEK